jgi:hypothetical protein
MSKFRVGDRVRVGPEAGAYWKGRVGEIVRLYTLGQTPYYVVAVDAYKEDVAFVEYELRPADIRAFDPEPQPGDGPEYHADHAYWKERQSK